MRNTDSNNKNQGKSYYEILSNKNGAALHQGQFNSLRHCIETAIYAGIDLSYANLRHKDLQNGNFDDGILNHADFTGSNLTGANLSEAQLSHAIFTNTDLYNTCLAYSCLASANFKSANFGATDITQANLAHASFAGLSAFTLDFRLAQDIRGCNYTAPDGTVCSFSQPPMIIHGQLKPCAILDNHIIYGNTPLQSPKNQLEKKLKMSINSSLIELNLTTMPRNAISSHN